MKKVEPLIALELPAEPHSAKVARDAVAGLDGHLGAVFGDVVLLISELVTNSVRHAGLDASQPLQLSVQTDDDMVRLAVRDPGPGFTPAGARRPIRRTSAAGASCSSTSWRSAGASSTTARRNVVWCELKRR